MRILKSILPLLLIITFLSNCVDMSKLAGGASAQSNATSSKVIENDAGGTVESSDQKLALSFPAGSLPEDELEITITPLESDGALGWDLQPDKLVLNENATATVTFRPDEDFNFNDLGLPNIIAVLESDDGTELEIIDGIKVTANDDDDTYTATIPIPHFTKLYVLSGLGSILEVSKNGNGTDAPFINEFVGDSDTNKMKVGFSDEVFAEATYPDGRRIRSEVTKSEVTAITIVDQGPTTSTVDLVPPLVFNNVGDEQTGTITTTCDAPGNGTVTVSTTFKHTITVTSTPGGVTDTRTRTRTISQVFPTTCKAKAAPPVPVIGICIHLKVVVGGCFEIGTTIFVTLDTNNMTLKIVGLGDTTISVNLTEDQLSGSTSIQIEGVSFFQLPHTLNLFLVDGVPSGFSLNEEGGPGQCSEEVLEAQEQEDNSSCAEEN